MSRGRLKGDIHSVHKVEMVRHSSPVLPVEEFKYENIMGGSTGATVLGIILRHV